VAEEKVTRTARPSSENKVVRKDGGGISVATVNIFEEGKTISKFCIPSPEAVTTIS
jgi:hypothetical protein